MAVTERIKKASSDLESAMAKAECIAKAMYEASGDPAHHDLDHPPQWVNAMQLLVDDMNSAVQKLLEAIHHDAR